MTTANRPPWQTSLDWFAIIAVFVIGFWLIVVRPLGPNLSQLPGDLGDTRFNNYILEHDYRWITGQDSNLWDAPFFYPYPQSLTFSDNHFGSMFFYDAFRSSGLDRETALQAWYLFSYVLSFAAAAYVLNKIGLKPLAIGLGAFFFTFGLPVLGQENHIQLFYRFCIPLASYAFWQFSQKQHFKYLVFTFFWLVWQFYLSIYMGYFLSMMLVVVAVGLPFTQKPSFVNFLLYWPGLFKKSWSNSKTIINILSLLLVAMCILALYILLLPYAKASATYQFTRPWLEVSLLLPRIQSYFISDHSTLWQPFASLTTKIKYLRWEHQLFVGFSTILLLVAGMFLCFRSKHRSMAYLFIFSAAMLVVLTLNFRGFSFYKYLWTLPGFNSIRSITRIILVLMWPISIFIAVEADVLLRISVKPLIFTSIVLLILGFMAAESIFYDHTTFSKADAQARLQTLREQIPTTLPKNPVLYVWKASNNGLIYTELDAMLLSQNLGWPAMNGYSGNFPPGYGTTTTCYQASQRIKDYMKFKGVNDPQVFSDFMSRIVSVGPIPCNLSAEQP